MSVKIETTKEEWWHFLIQQLYKFAEEYYITTRILYFNYNKSIMHSVIHNWAESIEKLLKLYVSINNNNLKHKDIKEFSHNIKILLEKCISINKKIFTNQNLIDFAEQYSTLWNQLFRYWFNSNYKDDFIKSYWIDINKFIDILDYIFFSIMKELYNSDSNFFLSYSWEIALLYDLNLFSEMYKKQNLCHNEDNIKKALEYNNIYIKDFLNDIYNFSLKFKKAED